MDNTCPKVSVVMPSLNVQPYIRECIESVIGQSLKDIEIICVDAGSTDGTLEILQEYAEADKRIQIINADRKSYGYQVNLGLKFAKGEYFAIVETDDFILPDMYDKLYSIADQHQLEVLKADFCIFVGKKEERQFTYRPIVRDKKFYNQIIDLAHDSQAILRAGLYSWAGIYRRDFLLKNNIYHNETPGASYQDNGFWFQIFTHAHRVMFYDKPFYMLRRDNPNSSFFSKAKIYCMCDEYDFIREKLRQEKELEMRFAPICALKRYYNYISTLERISDESKQEFLERFASDFKKIKNAGELEKSLFSYNNWNRLQRIMDNPIEFYNSEYEKLVHTNVNQGSRLTEKEIKDLQRQLREANQKIQNLNHEIKLIYNSYSFRIGHFITWIPRKIRGCIRCYKENGMRYTLRLVKEKIFGMSGS